MRHNLVLCDYDYSRIFEIDVTWVRACQLMYLSMCLTFDLLQTWHIFIGAICALIEAAVTITIFSYIYWYYPLVKFALSLLIFQTSTYIKRGLLMFFEFLKKTIFYLIFERNTLITQGNARNLTILQPQPSNTPIIKNEVGLNFQRSEPRIDRSVYRGRSKSPNVQSDGSVKSERLKFDYLDLSDIDDRKKYRNRGIQNITRRN